MAERLAKTDLMYYLCTRKPQQGSLAEWLGTGLQNRLQQFESARDLKKIAVNNFIDSYYYLNQDLVIFIS